MAFRFRHAVAAMLTGFTGGFMLAPTDKTLSDAIPAGMDAQAAKDYADLSVTATKLSDELLTIEFTESALNNAAANPALNASNDSVAKQVDELVALQEQTLQRRRKWDSDVSGLHKSLADSRSLSERQVYDLYTGPFGGQKYRYYYGEVMAYRDECRLQKASDMDACMNGLEDSETERALKPAAISAAAAGGTSITLIYGGAALAGFRRRRQDKRGKALLNSAKDLLRPRGG